MSAVGPNGTDRDEFASQWDDVVSRNLIATFLGTVSLPSHAVDIRWDRGTHSRGSLHSGRRGKFFKFDFASQRTNVTEVGFLVSGVLSLELSTKCKSSTVTTH
jgi:hypothetical protein